MNYKHNGKWEPLELGDLIDIFDNIRVPLNSRQRAERHGKFPYYGASGVIDSVDDYLFDGEYVLVAEDGENLNSRKLPVAFMARGQFWVNNHAHIIKGKKGVADDRFLIAWFAQADLKGYITGAAQPKLSQANLKRIALTAPPFPVQRKIASILSAYDDLFENNTRRIAILEEMAQAIYREWFVNFRFPGHEKVKLTHSPLGQIPEGWQRKALRDVAALRLGKMLDAKKNKGDLMPYLANINVRWGEFDLQNLREMRFEADERETYGLRYGDIVMCEGGEPGRCAIWTDQVPHMMIQKAIHRIRSRQEVDFRYLYYTLRHKGQAGHLESLFTGATIKHLPREKLELVTVEVPTKSLMDLFSKMVEPMSFQVEVLIKRNAILRNSRDLLLPKLISGQLDVEELDIETGESLVEV